MSIKLVVFDFDGTLVDTRTIFLGIVKKNVEKHGFKLDKKFVIKREEILTMIWDMEEEIMGKEN